MASKLIRLSKSCIGAAEKEAVLNVLDNEYLGMGQKVKDFEDRLSEYFGRPALCVVNGTAALHLALQAVGVGQGDEVLVPSITYVASYQAITATGAAPISCDIDPITLCLDVKDAKTKITAKTRAIMPVHYAGGFGEISEYYKLADENNLRVIEDSAHALGSRYQNKLIGSFGDIACFSFDGIKNITSGEGGCIVTNDEVVLSKIKDARLLGVRNDSDLRYRGERTWDVNVVSQGWRYHMSDIMAAIGIIQLGRLDEFSKARRMLGNRYNENLSVDPRIIPIINNFDSVVPHIYVVKIDGLKDRKQLRERLLEKNISSGVHYPPNHELEFFRNPDIKVPKTELCSTDMLSLPLHPELSIDEVDYICGVLSEELSLVQN